jgi:hypothetical protein
VQQSSNPVAAQSEAVAVQQILSCTANDQQEKEVVQALALN